MFSNPTPDILSEMWLELRDFSENNNFPYRTKIYT
jgi:hypothetical protein